METTRNNSRILLVILAAFAVCGWLWLRNGHHADARHTEAPALRSVINDSARTGKGDDGRDTLELYYSQIHGTILVLLRMPGGKAGGLVVKVTEVVRGAVMPMGEHLYERTAFIADELYWAAVVARDGYMPLSRALSIATSLGFLGALTAAIATLVRKLRGDGHNDLADHIERELKR